MPQLCVDILPNCLVYTVPEQPIKINAIHNVLYTDTDYTITLLTIQLNCKCNNNKGRLQFNKCLVLKYKSW